MVLLIYLLVLEENNTFLNMLKLDSALPAPKATDSRALGAICTGIPISLVRNWSRPLIKAPPPASIMPLSRTSADNSGGVISRVDFTRSAIPVNIF